MQKLRISGFLALCAAALAALCGASPAAAQLVISGSYYEEAKSSNGCVNGDCVLNFSATPSTGPLVLINKINCLLANLPGDALYFYFALRDTPSGSARRLEYLPVPEPKLSGQLRFYSFVVPSDLLFGNGKIPTLVASVNVTSNNSSLICKIAGRLQ